MVTPETQTKIAQIDKQIEELTRQRLALSCEPDTGKTASEALLESRRYERQFMYTLNSNKDVVMNSPKVMSVRVLK